MNLLPGQRRSILLTRRNGLSIGWVAWSLVDICYLGNDLQGFPTREVLVGYWVAMNGFIARRQANSSGNHICSKNDWLHVILISMFVLHLMNYQLDNLVQTVWALWFLLWTCMITLIVWVYERSTNRSSIGFKWLSLFVLAQRLNCAQLVNSWGRTSGAMRLLTEAFEC